MNEELKEELFSKATFRMPLNKHQYHLDMEYWYLKLMLNVIFI